jgi:hypothetical protein
MVRRRYAEGPVMSALEERVRVVEAKVEDHSRAIGGLGDLIVALDQKLDRRFESLERRFESFDRRFEAIDLRFESIDRRFESIDDLCRSTTGLSRWSSGSTASSIG